MGDPFFIPGGATFDLFNIGSEPLVIVDVCLQESLHFDELHLSSIVEKVKRDQLIRKTLRFDLPTF